jgi:AcrR family transcriptional regulator
MNNNDRLAREMADDLLGPIYLTPRQRKRQDDILNLTEQLITRFGPVTTSMRLIAHALRITHATLRWHFSDTDAILGEILRRHLHRLGAFLAEVPRDEPDYQRRKREAFVAFTRGPYGGATVPHQLFVNHLSNLPDDIRIPIENTYTNLGFSLAGDLCEEALDLLDNPRHDSREIERRLTATPPPAAPQPAAAPPVTAQPATSRQPAQPEPQPPPTPRTGFGPDMPPEIAAQLIRGDTTWLRPKGLGSAGLTP